MNANVGDHLVLRGHGSNGSDLRGEIVEILGEDGAPPYVVRWSYGYTTLFIASPDAFIDRACGRVGSQPAGHAPLQQHRSRSSRGLVGTRR
jgi:hypothetical protein